MSCIGDRTIDSFFEASKLIERLLLNDYTERKGPMIRSVLIGTEYGRAKRA